MSRVSFHVPRLLVQRWVASFDLFEPKELSLLLLASLNTFLRAGRVLLPYFSWLFVAAAYLDLRVDGSGIFCHFWQYTEPLYYGLGWEPRLYLCTLMLGAYALMLAVRSSLERKDVWYFAAYAKRLPLFSILFFLVPQVYTLPAFWLMSFCMLDAEYSLSGFLRSIYNGAVLTVLYFPYLLCVGAANGILFHIHRLMWELTMIEEYHFAPYAAKYAISLILYLLFVAMLHTFYARIVQGNMVGALLKRAH